MNTHLNLNNIRIYHFTGNIHRLCRPTINFEIYDIPGSALKTGLGIQNSHTCLQAINLGGAKLVVSPT